MFISNCTNSSVVLFEKLDFDFVFVPPRSGELYLIVLFVSV